MPSKTQTHPGSAHPWSDSAEGVAEQLSSNLERGLDPQAAQERLATFGPNQIEEARRRGPLLMFLGQFADVMVALLAVAAVISAAIGEWPDATLIGLIVLANAGIGFAQERRAERAIDALKRMSQPQAQVRRGGRVEIIPAAEVVPGDVVEVAAGARVPADARLIVAADLEVDESPLTGESLPVQKTTEPLPEDTSLADRTNMLYSGTALAKGRGEALVTATGMQTELGRIAQLLESAEAGRTPLQQRLAAMSRTLAIVVVGISIVIFLAGVLREPVDEWDSTLFSRMLLTAVSLAVAAIPEGLPAVITVTLALGSQRMAARKAIVRRLSAVETLGSVDVICSDKTGTLTQNRMTVSDLLPTAGDDALAPLLEAIALCSDAAVDPSGEVRGSATEAALLQAAVERDLDVGKLRDDHPRLDEVPFTSERKRMATLHATPDGERRLYVKGAAERILPRCVEHEGVSRDEWLAKTEELAATGRRVLAFAVRPWESDELPDEGDEAERDLTFLGLAGIVDPARPEASDAIQSCRSAGIRPVMITGDHPGTAGAIARDVGLLNTGDETMIGSELQRLDDDDLSRRAGRVAVYARVSPEHKLRIVRAHQAAGRIVAMTGDGVNDAPALKQADIGVAMGITGTDVSKEAAAMVLADDNFATIVAAVEEGRVVFDNIRKFVAYLLTANAGEVLLILACVLLGLPLPLLPVHLLWINLVTDGLPALALGFEPAEKDVMLRRPRRRDEGLFSGGLAEAVLLMGLLMAATCATEFVAVLHRAGQPWLDPDPHALAEARTMVFVTLSAMQLCYVLALRSFSESFLRQGLWSNYRLAVAVLAGLALQVGVVYVPFLRKFFHTVPLSAGELAVALLLSLLPFVATECWKRFRRRDDAADTRPSCRSRPPDGTSQTG